MILKNTKRINTLYNWFRYLFSNYCLAYNIVQVALLFPLSIKNWCSDVKVNEKLFECKKSFPNKTGHFLWFMKESTNQSNYTVTDIKKRTYVHKACSLETFQLTVTIYVNYSSTPI